MTESGSGSVLLAWQDLRAGSTSDIYATRVIAGGTIPAGWSAGGIPVCTAIGNQQVPNLVSDGRGGAIVSWTDFRSGAASDIYAQRIRATGSVEPGWPVDGVAVCTLGGNQQFSLGVADGQGGVVLAWMDTRAASGPDIYAHHVTATGAPDPAWPAGGREICTAFGNQLNPAVASDGYGGMLVTWEDQRLGGSSDLYSQHVQASGLIDPLWPLNGRAVSTAPTGQQVPSAIADGSGGVIIVWQDGRLTNGASLDIFAQRLQADGTLGGAVVGAPAPGQAAVASERIWPNPSAGDGWRVSWVLPTSAHAVLDLLDLTGRIVQRRELLDVRAGVPQALELGCRDCPPGIYFVRLRQDRLELMRRTAHLR